MYRIIGLIVLILGAYSLYNVALSISHPVETMNFPILISKITFAWVAIYGGYQTSSGRKLGHRMLIAWLSYQSVLIAVVALILLYNFITHENNFHLSFSYQNILIGFSIFCVPALF